tara:strand:+ start:17 stop:1054 length:1038 start_codon:yes stop_codon:yes gene_type:complete
MTSKIVVNNIQTDAGISSVTLLSHVAGHDSTQNISGINSVTANAFYGDGSNLTGAGPTLTNGADNRVVTATGANALNAETGVVITSDSELIVGMTGGGGASPDARLQVRGDTFAKAQIQVLSTHNDDNPASLQISKSRSSGNTILGDNDDIGQINFGGNDGNGYHNVGRIMVSSSGEGNGNDDLPTVMRFFTTGNGGVSLTERMRISSQGYVTKPYQPVFDVCGASGNPSGAGYITFTTVKVNIGSHYSTSTGKFIAPVAGTYFFSFGCIKNGNNNLARLYLYKNGSSANDRHLRMPTGGDGYGENGALTNIVTLAANDEIQVYMSEGTIHGGTAYTYFNGYLIG